jgi:hypothetical protein
MMAIELTHIAISIHLAVSCSRCASDIRRDLFILNRVTQILSGKVPYHEVKSDHQVILKLIKGERPERPQSIWIIDSDWKFICDCWSEPPPLRPNMVEMHKAIHQSLVVPCSSEELLFRVVGFILKICDSSSPSSSEDRIAQPLPKLLWWISRYTKSARRLHSA